MKKRRASPDSTPSPILIQFCDLSSSLDRRFLLVGHLVQGLDSDRVSLDHDELGELILDYLGSRATLEHVFLGRHLELRWDRDCRWRSEIWRLEKLKARTRLLKRRR